MQHHQRGSALIVGGVIVATVQELEARENWQATVSYTRSERTACIMRSAEGWHYLHMAEYDGLFPYGATFGFNLSAMRWEIERGIVRLLKGELPAE